MKSILIPSLLLLLTLPLAGCGVYALAQPPAETPALPPPSMTPQLSPTPTLTPFQPQSPTPAETLTPTATLTPTPRPSPTWVYHPAGELEAPILLYHHVDVSQTNSPYYVSPDAFRLQMESLHEWGYTTITMTLFAETLLQGGPLPERPVVITFDDGYQDVYDNAFPLMQELGFVGVLYLISNYVHGGSFVRPEQVQEMIAAGWEIGNHSATHQALTQGYSARLVQTEIVQSRLDLEELLGVPIQTFSYPYGLTSEALKQQLKDLGYLAAVGVGVTRRHSARAIYFLGRCEVRGNFTLEDFAHLLPWTGK